jgi:zinc protease
MTRASRAAAGSFRALVAGLAIAVCLPAGSSAAAQDRNWPSERPPRPLHAREVRFPPYEIQTLPNGLKVVVVLHHEQPAVSMRLLIRVGSASDPKGKLGLVQELSSLLDQGTETKSAAEMADAIDFIGGAMGAGAATDVTYLNMVVMKDSFETGMRMLSDMARHPSFVPAEMQRQRQQMLSSLQVSMTDPDFVADGVFDRLVYGFHPYGLPHTGTAETLNAITRDDLLAFHRTYFAPNNAILAVVGDVTAAEAFDMTKKVFGDWARKDVPVQPAAEPPAPMQRLIAVNKPDAVQTEVRVGHVGIQRKHPDYMAVNLAMRILGGEGSNRLHNVLRTQRGLTYGAQADMDALKDTGDFVARTNTRSEATGEVLKLVLEEFWRLQREPVNERELADAKAYLTGSFPLTIETPDAIAMQVLNVVFYDLPIEDLQNFRDRVNAVTTDDIQRVARAYLKPDKLSVALVGDVGAFAADLKGAGFPMFETIDLANLDLTAADFRAPRGAPAAAAPLRLRPIAFQRPDRGSPPPVTQADAAKAKPLVERAIASMGGLAKLRSIRNMVVTTQTSASGPDGTLDVTATTYVEYPNRVRVETRLRDVTSVQVYDGQQAWVSDPKGVHDVPATAIRELDLGLRRAPIALLLDAEQGRIQSRQIADLKEAGGRSYQGLEFSAANVEPIALYLDRGTGLVAKETYVAGGPGQPLIEETFRNYEPADGVQFARSATVRRGGQIVLERRISRVVINADLDPVLFKRPTP